MPWQARHSLKQRSEPAQRGPTGGEHERGKLWYRSIMEEEEEEEVLGMLDKVLEDEDQFDGELDLDSPLTSGEVGPYLLRPFQVREGKKGGRQGRKLRVPKRDV